jgi:hypothetical protein
MPSIIPEAQAPPSHVPQMTDEQVIPPTNRFGVAPPPGTLGRTYQRRSTLIDDDKHPRMAAVDVHLPEEADVTARGLKARWTGSVWRLETETPLLPGVPHIYAVKADRLPGHSDKTPEVRWVRLIPGRIVDLEFE